MKDFGTPDAQFIESLRGICGREYVLTATEALREYGHDETEDLVFLPHVVVRPASTAEVSAVVGLCARHRIPVTASGARTGLSGGALPVEGGVVLSLNRMNKILQIDEHNLQATVQPGVITQVLQEEVAARGLFYPPDPSSRGSCTLGGNLAEGAGGPKAVKYGTTRDYVLNLEVVLASGEVIWTGANVLKNSTGYNLTHLMIGSEGTLGIITAAVLRLIPLPAHNKLMLVPFADARACCAAVSAVFRAGVVPSAMEFMERDALDWVSTYLESPLEVPNEVQAHLLIEVDGNDPEVLMADCERILEVVDRFGAGEVLFAEDEAQKDQLWRMRRKVAEAVKSHSIYKEEDTVVPRFALPELLTAVKEIGRKYGFRSVCYGHAGDGNLHVNIIRGDLSEPEWNNMLPKAIGEIFEQCVALGGTLSGEHGIGWVQKSYMPIALRSASLELLKGIKSVFDPLGILNPGKILPDSW